MGRYRPPQIPGSKYITPEGFEKLQNELNHLWKIKRPEVTQSVREAAAQGDRSENAEYIYGKKQLREIDSRIRFLRKRLEGMNVIEDLPNDSNKIYFGAWVSMEDNNGKPVRYRIVGPDEIGDEQGFISIDSPLAKVLMAKSVDDEVSVSTPSGETRYIITGIRYSK